MIEALLGATDHGAGAFALEKQRIEASRFIMDAVDDMGGEFDSLGVNVEIAAAAELLIDADLRALKQMLDVLLKFPLRFVGPDTAIAIRAEHAGTDTVIEVSSRGLIAAAADDRDKLEVQLVDALALAHGARFRLAETSRTSRVARLTFFATRAAG